MFSISFTLQNVNFFIIYRRREKNVRGLVEILIFAGPRRKPSMYNLLDIDCSWSLDRP